MKKVALVAPLLTQSGYGVHSRQIARWLLQRTDVDARFVVVPWGITSWMLNPAAENGLVGAIMERSVSIQSLGDVDLSIQVQLPNEWSPMLGKNSIGITAGVETDTCNPAWVNACNKMSAVIVPSSHVANTLKNAGDIKVPLRVVPEAYPDIIVNDDLPEIDLPLERENNFLVVAQLTGNSPDNDRKNIFNTLKWLHDALGDRQDVGIVIKTNLGRMTRIDRKTTVDVFSQVLKEVRRSGRTLPVHLVHGSLSDGEIASLYRHPKIKALVSLTRGEGFGLPLLEAAASGLPIIATKWSGHTDFLSLGKYIEVDYTLQEIHASRVDNNIFMPGAKWAEPSSEDFKRKARKFVDNQVIPREWAADLRGKVLQKYSQAAINGYLDEAMKEFFE